MNRSIQAFAISLFALSGCGDYDVVCWQLRYTTTCNREVAPGTKTCDLSEEYAPAPSSHECGASTGYSFHAKTAFGQDQPPLTFSVGMTCTIADVSATADISKIKWPIPPKSIEIQPLPGDRTRTLTVTF